MEKKDIFVQIEAMEEQMGAMYADLTKLKATVVQLLEENQRLQIENLQLRRLIRQEVNLELAPMELEQEEMDPGSWTQPVSTTGPGEGYDNLNRIYQEGFHICNVYYGHLRTEGDCLFCLNFLNK